MDVSKFTDAQRKGVAPIITFQCPDVAYMYRVLGFALDTRVGVVRAAPDYESKKDILMALEREWGAEGFEQKIVRYLDLNLSFMGVPEEYYHLLWQVTSSYCCARYYPAMTSAGSLGERILNRLILRMRDYFKSSKYYKKVYSKSSILDWDFGVEVLVDWKVVSGDVGAAFLRLKKFRNDSVHYNNPYDFSANAKLAVGELATIIQKQFSYFERKDVLWVFDVPGEIWVKSVALSEPFVREFILPHCCRLTPFCEPTANPPIKGKNCPLAPISDLEFIELRKNRQGCLAN